MNAEGVEADSVVGSLPFQKRKTIRIAKFLPVFLPVVVGAPAFVIILLFSFAAIHHFDGIAHVALRKVGREILQAHPVPF